MSNLALLFSRKLLLLHERSDAYRYFFSFFSFEFCVSGGGFSNTVWMNMQSAKSGPRYAFARGPGWCWSIDLFDSQAIPFGWQWAMTMTVSVSVAKHSNTPHHFLGLVVERTFGMIVAKIIMSLNRARVCQTLSCPFSSQSFYGLKYNVCDLYAAVQKVSQHAWLFVHCNILFTNINARLICTALRGCGQGYCIYWICIYASHMVDMIPEKTTNWEEM